GLIGGRFRDSQYEVYGLSTQSYSKLTFAALIIGVQRAISFFTNAASGCGPRFVLPGTSPPMSERRLRTRSSSSALSRASLSPSRFGGGRPLGANNENKANP